MEFPLKQINLINFSVQYVNKILVM